MVQVISRSQEAFLKARDAGPNAGLVASETDRTVTCRHARFAAVSALSDGHLCGVVASQNACYVNGVIAEVGVCLCMW